MKKQNRKPNRYILIAKPNNILHINEITKNKCLDLSKVILIDVPNEWEPEEINEVKNLPKKKKRGIQNPRFYEEQVKCSLPEIDMFIFHHSTKDNQEEFRTYLNETLNYQIPENYDFSIVYRSTKKGNEYNEETNFKFLDPIYGGTRSIVLWLSEFAETEHQNRLLDKELAAFKMRETPAWKKVYEEFVKTDIKQKGSMVDHFNSWVDTRGYVSQIEKRKQNQEYEYMLDEITEKQLLQQSELYSLAKYPLSIIMYACRRRPNNESAWEILKSKLSSYKELRGFLLHRYYYKREELELAFENALKNTLLVDSEKRILKEEFNTWSSPTISFYDILRHTDYNMEMLEKKGVSRDELQQHDVEIRKAVEAKIKEKRKNDVPDVVWTKIHFKRNNSPIEKDVYMEHEEELLYPEDMMPVYPEEPVFEEPSEPYLKKKR